MFLSDPSGKRGDHHHAKWRNVSGHCQNLERNRVQFDPDGTGIIGPWNPPVGHWGGWHFTVFSAAYTQNLYLSHNFWKLTLKQQNLQNHTIILSLWLSFQFHKTLFVKHNTILYVTHKNLTGINIMAKVFANVCFWDVFVIFWMQCFILQEMWGTLYFVCAVLGFVCKVLKKKMQSFENVCKQLKKTVNWQNVVGKPFVTINRIATNSIHSRW